MELLEHDLPVIIKANVFVVGSDHIFVDVLDTLNRAIVAFQSFKLTGFNDDCFPGQTTFRFLAGMHLNAVNHFHLQLHIFGPFPTDDRNSNLTFVSTTSLVIF